MKTLSVGSNEMAGVGAARRGGVRGWQHWAPYAAAVWSLIYGALGLVWATGGDGFPYTAEAASSGVGAMVGRFGPGAAWVVVILAGIPAAAAGAAMLRGVRGRFLRPLFIAAGVLLAGALLLLLTDLNLLIMLGYIPFTLFKLVTGGDASFYLREVTQWTFLHQLVCLLGGFLWLGATVSYARRSGDACLACGRRDGPEGWTSPDKAARWGRIAVIVALVPPVFYGLTRYAWAVGIPLGMTEEYWRSGQERGLWVAGLFLANFGLAGAILSLGLTQRWGEIFPRWMIGLAGRRVPLGLAVVPAALASVLVLVGGIVIAADTGRVLAGLKAIGVPQSEIIGGLIFQLGPALLFPLWGVALAVATLGYYYRRRGPCKVCGRGGSGQAKAQS